MRKVNSFLVSEIFIYIRDNLAILWGQYCSYENEEAENGMDADILNTICQ